MPRVIFLAVLIAGVGIHAAGAGIELKGEFHVGSSDMIINVTQQPGATVFTARCRMFGVRCPGRPGAPGDGGDWGVAQGTVGADGRSVTASFDYGAKGYHDTGVLLGGDGKTPLSFKWKGAGAWNNGPPPPPAPPTPAPPNPGYRVEVTDHCLGPGGGSVISKQNGSS